MHGTLTSDEEPKVGYWTRDQIIGMDRAATLRMARHHPNHASPEIMAMLVKIKKRTEIPQFTPDDTNLLLAELFAALPESSDGEDLKPTEVRRMQRETAQAIRKAVAARHKITVQDLDSHCRNRQLVLARHEAMYLVARECTMFSYPRLGQMFGGKDHTTVLHAIRSHADRNGLPRIREGAA